MYAYIYISVGEANKTNNTVCLKIYSWYKENRSMYIRALLRIKLTVSKNQELYQIKITVITALFHNNHQRDTKLLS